MTRTFLTSADVVLPSGVVSGRTVVLEDGRIVDVAGNAGGAGAHEARIDLPRRLIVPGFIDVHVHGAAGADALDGDDAVGRIAARLPRWGVTAFCPTTVACAPDLLERCLLEVAAARRRPLGLAARVLPAHLETNFVNPDYRGAQPASCLRVPGLGPWASGAARGDDYTAGDVLAVIERHYPDVAIATMAPELDGGIDLVRRFAAAGLHVSLGHSGATFDEAQAAIAAGARQATHLFNRMRPMGHREPGLSGAVLSSDEVAAELVCDGHHVHPAAMRVAIAAKSPARMMAITDGTAGSGLTIGSRARLGGQSITVADVARLDDGTIAGSVLTMDRAFAYLVGVVGLGLEQAVEMCSATPARELRLQGLGAIVPGALADLVVLDAALRVEQTWIGGRLAFAADDAAANRTAR